MHVAPGGGMRRLFSTIAGRSLQIANSGWDAAIRRGPGRWLTLSGALLVAGSFVVTIIAVGEFRERSLTNRERELENTVVLLARHFDQQFEASDAVAAALVTQM